VRAGDELNEGGAALRRQIACGQVECCQRGVRIGPDGRDQLRDGGRRVGMCERFRSRAIPSTSYSIAVSVRLVSIELPDYSIQTDSELSGAVDCKSASNSPSSDEVSFSTAAPPPTVCSADMTLQR
jgi:hypothetical protein